MDKKQLAEMIKRIRQEKLDEIYVNPNNNTPAGRAYSGALKGNQGKAPLPLQAGQRLSPIGDQRRGRVVKTTNRFVPKRPISAPLDANRNAALDKPTTQSPMAIAQRRQDAADAARTNRVGTNTYVATQRAEAQRRREAGEPVLKAKDVPGLNKDPKAIASAQEKSNKIMANARTGGQPLIRQPVDMRGGGGDYRQAQTVAPPTKVAMAARKIEAPKREVSAAEIVKDKDYQANLLKVGGEKAARNLAVGTKLDNLGTLEKGQSIWSKTKEKLSTQASPEFQARKGGAGR